MNSKAQAEIQAAGFDPGGTMSPAAGRAAAFLKTLAHEGRLEILCLLLDSERTVSEVETALGLSQSAVSQQLMRLRAEGLVAARRAGRNVLYSVGRRDVHDVVAVLRDHFCQTPD